MKRSWIVINLVALIVLAALACAKAPQDDIGAAQAEMDKANQAHADTWAPTEYAAAKEAMDAATAEIAAQDGKWMKNYDKGKELLAKAKENAAKATEVAAANREQTKKDAEAGLAAADTAIQAAEAALKTAPQTKDSKADLALMKNDLATLRATLDQARQSFSSEDYKRALDSAGSVKEGGVDHRPGRGGQEETLRPGQEEVTCCTPEPGPPPAGRVSCLRPAARRHPPSRPGPSFPRATMRARPTRAGDRPAGGSPFWSRPRASHPPAAPLRRTSRCGWPRRPWRAPRRRAGRCARRPSARRPNRPWRGPRPSCACSPGARSCCAITARRERSRRRP